MSRFTDKYIKNLTTAKKEAWESDGDNLWLRLRNTGNKTWYFRYRRPSDNKTDKLRLGVYPRLTLKEARSEAKKAQKILDKGLDPKMVRAAELAENASALTTGAVFTLWLEHLTISGEITPRTIKQHGDRWQNHLKIHLDKILVRDITRSHISRSLDLMRQKGIREEVRKALTTISLLLDYAVSRHYIEVNHARLLKPKDFGASANRPADRALSLAELRQVWAGVDAALVGAEGIPGTAKLSILTATAIKLLIITGARRAEVIGMQWSELDLAAGIWQLPKERVKNRVGHTIYLPSIAVSLARDIAPLTGSSIYVFESQKKPGQPVRPESLTQAVERLRGVRKGKKEQGHAPLEGMEPFSVHDLRRSAATAWGEHLKVLPHVIEAMLNHQPRDKLIATYQRASYQEEQKAAWLAWGAKIEAVIARDPGNVVPINQKAK